MLKNIRAHHGQCSRFDPRQFAANEGHDCLLRKTAFDFCGEKRIQGIHIITHSSRKKNRTDHFWPVRLMIDQMVPSLELELHSKLQLP